jgi:hydrogenase expression/formation protein HypC
MCLGVPGEVLEISERHGLRFARVRFGGISRDVCLEYQPDAVVGDFVLVHVGFAISTIDRAQAAETWRALAELGELDPAELSGPVEAEG